MFNFAFEIIMFNFVIPKFMTKSFRQSLIRCLLFIVLLSSALVAAAQKQYEVSATKLNVRSEAKSNGKIIGSVTKGEVLSVSDISNGWAEIRFNGRKGFVSSQYLKAVRRSSSHSSSSQRTNNGSWNNETMSSSYSGSSLLENRQSGLGMTADMGFGYSHKVFSVLFGYDLGYQLKHMLYFGVGPVLQADFSDYGSGFGAGGALKIRFTAPLKSKVSPMVGFRLGYLYNFTASSGGLFFGPELAICIKQHFNVGIQLNITSTTTRTEEQRTNTFSYTPGGKTKTVNYTHVEEVTNYFFAPFVFFSYSF